MNIEVLLSTMYQNGFEIVEKCNIKSNAIIVNQCNEEKIEIKEYSFGTVKMIYTKTRGLSNSRNLALKYSTGDICVLCDDDIVYHDDYVSTIAYAFLKHMEADLIVFNVISKNPEKRKQEKLFKKAKKIPFYKTYSSVHIAFKKNRISEKGIHFNSYFGAGSGYYSFAEDSIFFNEIHKNKLISITYPAIIADLHVEKSSWFTGFNGKYFYDTGAFLAESHPRIKNIYKWYYPLRLHNSTELKIFDMIQYLNDGMKGYENKLSFDSYYSRFKNGIGK